MAAKTILVVDKDIITIKKIMKTLKAEGFLVLNASNKFSGLRAAKELKTVSSLFCKFSSGLHSQGFSLIRLCRNPLYP